MVGRESELGHLQLTLDALDGGGAACVTIEGEPGIGKTRLLAELRRRAEERGHVVLSGAAAEFERDMPFSVWVDALDAYVVAQGLTEHEDWDAGPGRRAGRCPAVAADAGRRRRRDRRRALPRPPRGAAAAGADRRRAAARAGARRPALERRRVDRADRRADRPRAGRAGAARAGLSARGRRTSGSSAAVADPPVTRLELEQLRRERGGRAARPTSTPTRRAAIYRHGGGNPFYLEQLGRASGRTSAPRSTARAAEGGRARRGRAARSRGELESLLRAVARASSTPRPSPASRSSRTSPPRSPGCRRGRRAGRRSTTCSALDLVRPTEVPRRFIFRHPLVRRAVYESTRGGWRLGAHARAAAALARARRRRRPSAPTTSSSRPAQGDQEAIAGAARGRPGRGSRARRRPRRAGSRPRCACCPTSDAERQVEVRVALASALRSLGELERCRDDAARGDRAARPRGGRPARRADRAAAPRSSTGRAATRTPTAG